MKNRRELFLLIVFLIVQTIIYVLVGMNKPYLHIDEAYSFGLTNYNKVDIQDNEDFYNTWHSNEYFDDYLSIQENEKWDFAPVYENQKNDVHPPLYYLLLRTCMELSNGQFSLWPGIILNIIIYIFVTVFMYLILRKLLKNDEATGIKAVILAFMSSIMLASISNVIYIRMYSLLTLEILIIIFLHIKLLENEAVNLKILIAIGISVLAGVLTHYYYLFYLGTIYIIFLIKYLREKRFKELIYYTLVLVTAGVTSLIIFPYSLQHIFFGYRGQGVFDSLKNTNGILAKIKEQIKIMNYYGFNKLMYVIIFLTITIWIINKVRKKNNFKLDKYTKEILIIITIPSILFFLISAIASPWQVLRYIVPICGLIFILLIYLLYKVLKNGFNNKIGNIIIGILFFVILVSPFALKLKPELLFNDRKEFMNEIEYELNVPTIYLYESSKDRLLDDILVFEKVDNSYIAKDIEYTKESIQKIIEGKDTSKGILILLNQGENTDNVIDTVKNALNLENSEYLQRLTSCDVYYVY